MAQISPSSHIRRLAQAAFICAWLAALPFGPLNQAGAHLAATAQIPTLLEPAAPLDDVVFVNHAATGANNGASWTDAYTSLQAALENTASGNAIWVAQGVYTPTHELDAGDPRSVAFQLVEGVYVYGGFEGSEASLSQRDWMRFSTILSGDLDGNDVGFTNNGENSYHVIVAEDTNLNAIMRLDGFYIQGGNANVSSGFHDKGGGIYVDSSFTPPTISYDPWLSNLVIQGNNASQGGGLYNQAAYPIISSSYFLDNHATSGAGMYNDMNNTPVNNQGPELYGVFFGGNIAVNQGGGMRNINNSDPLLADCVFSGNLAVQGGAISNLSSDPRVYSSTFYGNTGFAIYNSGSHPTFSNSILYGNPGGQVLNFSSSTSPFQSSLIQGGCPSGQSCFRTLQGDPHFIDADGLDNIDGTMDDDLRLTHASPAIDYGDNDQLPADTRDLDGDAYVTEKLPLDFDRRPRQVDLPFVSTIGLGTPPYSDLGAYETRVIYVNLIATGANDGKTWASAFTSLQSALDIAVYGDEAWVARGVYKPTLRTDPLEPRSAAYTLKRGLAIYGGFAGGETARSQSNPSINPTTLSGDLGVIGNIADNSYHVVVAKFMDPKTILDGFEIRDGNANGGSVFDSGGGGMYNQESNAMLVNLVFTKNTATSGGGLYNERSNSNIINCGFYGNTANFGAGMRDYGSNPTIANAAFSGNNAAVIGGGVYNTASNPTIVNATFYYNQAPIGGGGGIYNGNHPAFGGSKSIIQNSILWANTGSQVVNEVITSTAAISYSVVQFGCPFGSTCDALLQLDDPKFVDPNGRDNIYGTPDDDLHVTQESKVIDAGDNTAVPPDLPDLDGDGNTTERLPLDLSLNTRFFDLFDKPDTGIGPPPIADRGAFEYLPVFYVLLPFVSK